jgi:hypothetical protein
LRKQGWWYTNANNDFRFLWSVWFVPVLVLRIPGMEIEDEDEDETQADAVRNLAESRI